MPEIANDTEGGRPLPTRSKAGPVGLLIAGIFLCLGPLWGFIATFLGMLQSFNAIASTGRERAPEVLAQDISSAMWWTAGGFIALPLGIGAVIIATVWLRRLKIRHKGE